MNRLTYEAWKQKVDDYIRACLDGLTSDDLPDFDYRNSYDAGERACDVATQVMRAARQY